MKKKFRVFAAILAWISMTSGALRFFRVRSAAGAALSAPKMLAGALSPLLTLAGAVSMTLGVWLKAPWVTLAGVLGTIFSGDYMRRVLAPHREFAHAFDPEWRARLSSEQRERLLLRRWQVPFPKGVPSNVRWTRDVVFWTLPGTERELLCDIWQPPEDVAPSGLVVLYFHGSGWHFLDKDVGTRPMFRHWVAQGHTVVDVAYRLCPETDWRGMVGDVKRAIAWVKVNASQYGVDPARVVLAGGSAGGHLALLAAYTASHPEFTPDDVATYLPEGVDLSAHGVVSWYGPSDMAVYYTHAGLVFSATVEGPGKGTISEKLSEKMALAMGFDMTPPAHWPVGITVQEAMMRALFGGTLEEIPDVYRQASPITYAGAHCPPTLLLQGEHDSIVSAEAVRVLAQRLAEAEVPVVHVEYPQTEHAFDLILPQISPPAQAALYETDRFLALMV